MNFKGLSLILLALLAFSTSIAASPLRVAISSAPSNLSPFFSTDANSQNINRLIHTSLVDFNENMEATCRFCRSYKESFFGGTYTITFELRKDLKFSDGSKVTAKDVKNSWKYFTEVKSIKSIFRFAFGKIKNVIIHSDYKVELVYEKYEQDSLSNLTLLKIIKLNKVKEKLSLEEIIGAGSYKIGKIEPLEIELSPLSNNNPALNFKVVKDETTLALKLMNKEIDISIADISPRKISWIKRKAKKNNLRVIERNGANYKYIGLNHKSALLKDVRTRQALSLLIPRESILKNKLKRTAELSKSMFSPAFKSIKGDFKVDEFNIKKAKGMLKAVGFKKGKSKKLELNGKVFELNWKVSNNKATVEIVNTIKSYFEKVGIKVNVIVQEWGIFMKDIKKGDFDIFVGQWVGFTGPEMMKYVFHSQSIPPKGANRGHFVNKEFDKLIDMTNNEPSKEKRDSYYTKALGIVKREYPYIDLWHPKIIWMARDCVKSLNLMPTGSFLPLLNIVSMCGK